MNILAIGAHPDDIELGCSGWIARLAQEGHIVSALTLSGGMLSRGLRYADYDKLNENRYYAGGMLGMALWQHNFSDNAFDSVPLLEIVQAIEAEIEREQPSLILTHSAHDLNIDHRITHQATLTATRPPTCVKEIYAYEICSSSEWNFGNTFAPNHFVDISQTIDKKLEVLKCYETEMRDWPHPRSIEGVRTLARYRGMQCGVEYAEAFSLVRRIP